MKILFLDIDGVLNSRAYDRRRNWDEQTNIDETRLPLLREIVDRTGAAIVLISTWRAHLDDGMSARDAAGEYVVHTFAKYGLRIFGKTPDLGPGADRKDEVAAWLAERGGGVEKFAILDDHVFGWAELSPFYVHTDPHFGLGLEEEQVKRAVGLLNGEEG